MNDKIKKALAFDLKFEHPSKFKMALFLNSVPWYIEILILGICLAGVWQAEVWTGQLGWLAAMLMYIWRSETRSLFATITNHSTKSTIGILLVTKYALDWANKKIKGATSEEQDDLIVGMSESFNSCFCGKGGTLEGLDPDTVVIRKATDDDTEGSGGETLH